MKILIVGDIVGRPGRNTLKKYLEKYRNTYDFIIVNGENSAAGFGITEKIAEEFFSWGVDVITGGNHSWDKKEIYDYLNSTDSLLRPHNYPEEAPGKGYVIKEKKASKIAVISLQGRVFMNPVDCPFRSLKKLVEKLKKTTNNIIVDFHAEATSEKIALARYISGEVSLIYGTHTHVQTADEKIFETGTAYISDIGMTGSQNGVIGTLPEVVINKFLTSLPQKFDIAEGNEYLNGLEINLDTKSGKTKKIKRIIWSKE